VSVSRVMVPFEAAAPAGSSPFAALAAAGLAGIAFGTGAIRAAAARRKATRRDEKLSADRQALIALARAHADTQPGFAADLYCAATRDGEG
jgi:hypothetical protein